MVTLVAVARPERSETRAMDPAPMVAELKLRVPYVQISEMAIMFEAEVVPPVIVLVPFVQTSAAKVPKVVSERVVEPQTAVAASAAERLFKAEMERAVARPEVAEVTSAEVASGETALVRPAEVASGEVAEVN